MSDVIYRFLFTFQVTPYDFTKNNVKITVFDTPGLADGTGNDERYLLQILEKVKTVDLFLFCTDMTSRRFSDDDAKTVTKLTKTFGASLWDHALVVLTFANQVHLNAKEKDHTVVDLDQQRISFFQKRIRDFQKKIQKVLLSRGVHQEAMSNLPFVPAGEVTKPRLPDRENWLTALWIAAFKRINRNAKADFLLANFDRISISWGGLLSESRAETDRARGVGAREGNKEDRIDDERSERSLRRSSTVIDTSQGAKRGPLRRSSATVSRDVKDRFHARRRIRSSKGSMDEKDSEIKTTNAGYKDCAADGWCDDHDGDVKSKFNRLSVSELETERHVYSPQDCLIQSSLPPAYDEVVRNKVPLPMDESSSQELLKEMVQEAIGSQQTREFVGTFASQSGFSRIYAALFAKIVEFIKKLLRRGKKTTEAMRQKEDADKC